MNAYVYDLVIIVVYFIGILTIGIWAGRKESSLEDFSLGGRSIPWWAVLASILAVIPWWAVLASILAVETSAATFLGAPAEGYRSQNILYVQLTLGTILARIVIAYLFIKPYYHYQVYTVYEFLKIRFGETTRNIGSLIFLFTRILASGIRLYIASVILVVAWKYFTGSSPTFMQYVVAISIMTVVTTLVSVVTILYLIPGGWEGIKLGTNNFANFRVFDSGLPDHPDLCSALLSIFQQEYTIWAALFGATFLTMATHGTDQDMVQRMLTATNYKRSQLSLVLSGIADIPIALVFVLIGVFLYAFFQVSPDPALPSAHNEVFAYFIIKYMPVGVRGLIIAGVFASAMSSFSAALNALATSFVKDFYMPYLKKDGSKKHYVSAARISTVVFAFLLVVVAVLAAYQVLHNPEKTIIPMALGIIGYTYGPLLGVFLIGMLTRNRGNNTGNALAMLCGFLTVLILSGTADTILSFFNLPLIQAPRIAFTWYIMFGSVVTFIVGVLFRSHKSCLPNPETS